MFGVIYVSNNFSNFYENPPKIFLFYFYLDLKSFFKNFRFFTVAFPILKWKWIKIPKSLMRRLKSVSV